MSVWDDVKSRLSVEEVLADYVTIRSKGANLTCLCPFHNEKNPSLIISPSKGIWHCFGCGAGGDIFAFVTQFENTTKQEALIKLAKKAGIDLDKYKTRPNHNSPSSEDEPPAPITKTHDEQAKAMLTWSTNLYHQILLKFLSDKEHPITKYCLQRGLTLEIIKKFQLGYAPKNNQLLQLATKHNIDLELLFEVGLLRDIQS